MNSSWDIVIRCLQRIHKLAQESGLEHEAIESIKKHAVDALDTVDAPLREKPKQQPGTD